MRFEQVQRFILAKNIFWGEGHFKMCHFLLDVHGRARIIASWLFKLCDFSRGRTAWVVRIELLE